MQEHVISVAVCDDESDTRTELIAALAAIPLPYGFKLLTSEFASGDELLKRHGSGERFDIFLLDIYMPGSDGIATAQQLRARDDKAIIIYESSSADFALQAYRVSAFDYLIKAKDDTLFASVLEKAFALVAAQDAQRLQLRSGTTLHSILCANIEYIEIFGKKLCCHIAPDAVIESYTPIHEVEAILASMPHFHKIHRSIIVNLSHIIELDTQFVKTLSSERLPVARGKYPALRQAFLRLHATSH